MRWEPPLPPGRTVDLPGRGTTFVRELPGPDGAPTVVLLHGWTVSADLNWFHAYETLGRSFRVVAMDHRGHGRGIRTRRHFRLADCADDVVAVADHLGLERFIPVGYSMGGPISLLTWHRHRDRVAGLVLCATAPVFGGSPGEQAAFSMLPILRATSRVSPGGLRRRVAQRMLTGRLTDSDLGRWAAGEIRRGDSTKVIEAGISLGRFDARPWLADIDVPTAVVRTTLDRAVPPIRQTTLATHIRGARVIDVAADHACCVTDPRRFVPVVDTACRAVAYESAPS